MSRRKRNAGGTADRLRRVDDVVYSVVVTGRTLNGLPTFDRYGPFTNTAAAIQAVNSIRLGPGTPREHHGRLVNVWIEQSGFQWEETSNADQAEAPV